MSVGVGSTSIFADGNLNIEHLFQYEIVKSPAMNQYLEMSDKFQSFHQNPTNVLLHMLTTPLGFIGVFGLLRNLTNGSTMSLAICMIYLLSLVRTLPLGVFLGTFLVCLVVGVSAKSIRLNIPMSMALIVVGYVLQDLAHMATQEQTFQASYSNGGHVDVKHLDRWFNAFLEHCLYLIPLVVQSGYSVFIPHDWALYRILMLPLPPQVQQVYTFAYVLTPLFVIALGSYCIDSRNGFCFFPGTPYFNRIIQCNVITNDANCSKEDMDTIRKWTIEQHPSHKTSSHWWFRDLPAREHDAFDRVAKSPVIANAFRAIFKDSHVRLPPLRLSCVSWLAWIVCVGSGGWDE